MSPLFCALFMCSFRLSNGLEERLRKISRFLDGKNELENDSCSVFFVGRVSKYMPIIRPSNIKKVQ